METWEELRTSWVNGNKGHVTSEIAGMSTREIINVIYEAMCCIHNSIPVGTPISGDLQDLSEIMAHFKAYGTK